MRPRFATIAILFVLFAATATPAVSGQAPPPPPPAPPAPATAPVPAEPPVPPAPPRPRTVRPGRNADEVPRIPSAPSKNVNIRVDATVSESRGTEVIAKKVLSVTVVDGENGSVRSTLSVPFRPKGVNAFSYDQAPLNMDARVRLLDDDRVRVSLVLDYKGGRIQAGDGQQEADAIDQGIRQAITVMLENGKPMVVAQSADAIGDRRVTLEVKATVLK